MSASERAKRQLIFWILAFAFVGASGLDTAMSEDVFIPSSMRQLTLKSPIAAMAGIGPNAPWVRAFGVKSVARERSRFFGCALTSE